MKFNLGFIARALGLSPSFARASQNLVSQNNIVVNPVNVLWQIEAMEQLDFTGCVGSAQNNKSIHLFMPDGTEHYFWLNYNSTGSDPLESGTAHAVAVTAGASDTAIALDFKNAIAAVSGFTAALSAANAKVVIVCRTLGTLVGEVSTPTTTFTAAGLTLTQIRRGKDFNLGLLKGDIGPKFGPSNFSVLAHQYGKTPLASLNQGFEKIEVALKLLETDAVKLQTLYKIYGGSQSGATTTVYGAGSSVLGKNILIDAARLIFKPVNATDNTKNVNFPLALPVPGSLTFSGENPSELEVTFNGFIDLLLKPNINAMCIGDIFQTGLSNY